MTQVKLLVLTVLCMIFLGGEAMAMEKPWRDWPDTDIEAGWYVKNEKIFQGHVDGLFHPHNTITSFQFCNVLERVGIPVDRGYFKTTEVYMKDTQKFLPDTAFTADPQSFATRYRVAVMIYRYLHPEEVMEERLEKWFLETKVTWNGVTRPTKLVGYANVFVNLSKEYNVPIWLALGQAWRESQWFTTGLSIDYNCGFGMKDSTGRWGPLGNPPLIKGFSNYTSVGESIHAYYKLMSSTEKPYRALIDSYLVAPDSWQAWGFITQALDIYAPGYENDTIEHHKIVQLVKTWCDKREIK